MSRSRGKKNNIQQSNAEKKAVSRAGGAFSYMGWLMVKSFATRTPLAGSRQPARDLPALAEKGHPRADFIASLLLPCILFGSAGGVVLLSAASAP